MTKRVNKRMWAVIGKKTGALVYLCHTRREARRKSVMHSDFYGPEAKARVASIMINEVWRTTGGM